MVSRINGILFHGLDLTYDRILIDKQSTLFQREKETLKVKENMMKSLKRVKITRRKGDQQKKKKKKKKRILFRLPVTLLLRRLAVPMSKLMEMILWSNNE